MVGALTLLHIHAVRMPWRAQDLRIVSPEEGTAHLTSPHPLSSSASFPPKVLNMHGKVVTVRHQAVTQKKDNRFAVALDSDQNNIHVKDIVKVIDGPHSVSVSTALLLSLKELGWGLPCPACDPPFCPGPRGRDPPSVSQLCLPALQEAGGEWRNVCLQGTTPGVGWGLKGKNVRAPAEGDQAGGN